MRIIYSYILLIVLILSSCHGKRLATKNFMLIDDFSTLDGRYINTENRLSHLFNLRHPEVNVDIIDVNFSGKDSLILSYVDIEGAKRVALKGKKKKNFFEIYFQNTRIFLPPLLISSQIDRLRIGKDKDENLLIYKWDEHYGMIMPLGAGGSISDEYESAFFRYGKNIGGLFAIQVGDKWGYANGNDSIVIAPMYDYAQPFNNGVAKVFRDNLYGFINEKNQEIIPLMYDTIMKPTGNVIRVCKDGKWGLIDSLNNEITELKYDRLLAFRCWHYGDSSFPDLAEIHLNGKIGLINQQGVEIIPPEYDEIKLYPTFGKGGSDYFRTRLGDKYGYASKYGVLCKPVFDKAGKHISYNGFSPKNETLVDNIGRYTEVVYNGEPYLFTEKGMLYKYKKLGFFKENRLVVDFDSGFYLDAK